MFQLTRAYFYCFIPLSLFLTVTAAVVFGSSIEATIGMDILELIVFGTGFIMTANIMKTNPNSGGKQGAYWFLAHLIFMLVSTIVSVLSTESGSENELELLPVIIGVFAILPLAIATIVFEIAAMIWLFNNSANVPK